MAANSQAFDGAIAEAYWTPEGGGSPVKISGPSTTINIEEEANSIDAGFRDNTQFKLAGTPSRSATIDYLDWEGGTPMDDLELGEKGTMDIYPEGNEEDLRKWTVPAQVVSRPYTSEINAAAGGTMGFDFTGPIVRSVVVA